MKIAGNCLFYDGVECISVLTLSWNLIDTQFKTTLIPAYLFSGWNISCSNSISFFPPPTSLSDIILILSCHLHMYVHVEIITIRGFYWNYIYFGKIFKFKCRDQVQKMWIPSRNTSNDPLVSVLQSRTLPCSILGNLKRPNQVKFLDE